MPIYEYHCLSCDLQFQILIMNRDQEKDISCPGCGGKKAKRLISRVAYHVSEDDRLAALDSSSPKGDDFYKDTRNIGLEAKKRARRMGVDLGEGFETKLEKLRTDPSSIIKDGP